MGTLAPALQLLPTPLVWPHPSSHLGRSAALRWLDSPSSVHSHLAWDLALCPLLSPQVRTKSGEPDPTHPPRRSRAHFGLPPLLPQRVRHTATPQTSLVRLEPERLLPLSKALVSTELFISAPSLGEQGDLPQATALPGQRVLWVLQEGWRPLKIQTQSSPALRVRLKWTLLLASWRHELTAPSAGLLGRLHRTPSAWAQEKGFGISATHGRSELEWASN